ncbi:hypothetical protein G7062_05890 [Erysipelothrix sp. HDW6C]|uniref:hypothetical protein n=1 Tax=Erysipelothrix sp. HDW6C TaxID=2714930 RepID=UPI00140873A4|nr:hypothetical protein [Erysipelothrix sp. HDW6C]QIK69851.1 hypothetical protein G7062_05890 [Erysipelothrix sp. HDW6C]
MSVSYGRLNIELMQLLDGLDHLGMSDAVDETILEKQEFLARKLLQEGVPPHLMKLIFHESYLYQGNPNDSEIMNFLGQDMGSDVANTYAKMLIDFYVIESRLRFDRKPMLDSYGTIPSTVVNQSHTVRDLIYTSMYFRDFENINRKNYPKLMDEFTHKTFKSHAYEAMSLNGVIAKSILYCLKLNNYRIIQKGRMLGLDVDEVVRNYGN